MPTFNGFNGEIFQFNACNKFFNLLTDETLQINAYFNSYGNIDLIGLKTGLPTTYIKWLAENEKAEINNKKLNSRSYFSVSGKNYLGYAEIKFELEANSACLKPNNFVSCLFINLDKYRVYITRHKKPNLLRPYLLNIKLNILDRNVRPHGIIGQTAELKPRIPSGEQGVIFGKPVDYEVNDLWTSSFKYNKFKDKP